MCDAFATCVEERNAVLRLLAIVSDRWSPPEMLPDVLALLGILSQIDGVPALVGSVGGATILLGRIRLCVGGTGTPTSFATISATISNCCLALAGYCSKSKTCTDTFRRQKGVDVLVELIRSRALLSDATSVNAASAVVCNLCFNNDEMRKEFGKGEACEALVEVLRAFDPSQSSSKSMVSMFKAMGNLALDVENHRRLLKAQVEEGYSHFLSNVVDQLDVVTLENAIQTLSNLCVENTEENMRQFQHVIAPALAFIRKQLDVSATPLYSKTFEVLGQLCRRPDNARYFCENAGIRTVLTMLWHTPPDHAFFNAAILLIGMQTNEARNIELLLSEGVYEFIGKVIRVIKAAYQATASRASRILSALLSDGDAGGAFEIRSADLRESVGDVARLEASTLPINTFRAARRIMTNKRAAYMFAQQGCVRDLAALLSFPVGVAMLLIEALTIVLKVLALCGAPNAEAPETEGEGTQTPRYVCESYRRGDSLLFRGDVSDENVLPHWERSRPDGPRTWQKIGLTIETLREFVLSIRWALTNADNHKGARLQRLGLGLLGYIACEKSVVPQFFVNLNVELGVPVVPAPTPAPENPEDPPPKTPRSANRKRKPTRPLAESATIAPNDMSIEAIARRTIANFRNYPTLLHTLLHLLGTLLYCAVESPHWVAVLFTSELRHDVLALDVTGDEEYDETLEHVKAIISIKRKIPSEVEKFEEILAPWTYPMSLTGWDEDAYPNGTQSLPAELKEKIRMGGKMEVCGTVGGKRVMHKWKASHDLSSFMHRPTSLDREPAPLHECLPAGRIRAFLTTDTSPALRKVVDADKGNDGEYLTLCCRPCREVPSGKDVHMRFRGNEREVFLRLVVPWRDAAVSGFLSG
eukprot:Polyplicarium_translucidae@DN2960_c0_g1_i6.p1